MKEKDIKKLIPKVYKWNAENLGLFFFVRGQLQIVPAITIDQSIRNYFKFINDDWDIETARSLYYRMQKDFLNESTEKDC